VNPMVPTDETRGAFHPDAAFVLVFCPINNWS
jgi:hypothetical protein